MLAESSGVIRDSRPAQGPSAWDARLANDPAWRRQLVPAAASELRLWYAAATSDATQAGPAVHDLAAQTIRELDRGRGFVVWRSWPLADDDRTARGFAAFGQLLGRVRAQGDAGELHRFVEDRSRRSAAAASSGSSGNMAIALHTENAKPPGPPSMIALLCLRGAVRGGESILASCHTVYNTLLAEAPEHFDRLCRPVPFGRRPEDHGDRPVDWQPVFSGIDRHRPFVRYSRYWIDLAVQQFPGILDDAALSAITAVDAILERPTTPIVFGLEPGDAVFIENATVLHGRNEFTDGAHQRRLVRIWIDRD